jgi:hypothetical protein
MTVSVGESNGGALIVFAAVVMLPLAMWRRLAAALRWAAGPRVGRQAVGAFHHWNFHPGWARRVCFARGGPRFSVHGVWRLGCLPELGWGDS